MEGEKASYTTPQGSENPPFLPVERPCGNAHPPPQYQLEKYNHRVGLRYAQCRFFNKTELVNLALHKCVDIIEVIETWLHAPYR